MPLSSHSTPYQSLFAQGQEYQILFSFKQDSSKQIFKAMRKDKVTGVKQEVLLKIFLGEKESYKKEFESVSKIFSPFCVRLLGFENFGSKQALVLEYIKGISLFQLVENFSLSRQEIEHILSSIYKGLVDLNKQGLCHGDLSLDNVLIDKKACIKLIDFGRANYENKIQGTPPFMAPELLKGARANFLSDLYSLGVISVLLKSPTPLSSLKNFKIKDLGHKNLLLSSDPVKRVFPSDIKPQKNLRSLSYKVKDLLYFMESKRCSTVKNIHLAPLSAPTFLKSMVFILSFTFLSSSQTNRSPYGLLKIYTNKWFMIRVGGFESYSPFNLPLKEGWHSIEWEHKTIKGKKTVFVSQGESLFLNDKSFLRKELLP